MSPDKTGSAGAARPAGFPPLNIIFEDPHYLAVVKPSGILVQRDINNHWSLYEEVKEHLAGGFTGVLHRLDRTVAGIVLFAKTSTAAAALSKIVRKRRIGKVYYAVLQGILDEKKGSLVHFIEKKGQWAVVFRDERPEAKRSELGYEVLEEKDGKSLVRIELLTGRYNQIRAQFAYIKRPVLGDFKYMKKPERSDRIALVAAELSFIHPFRNEEIRLRLENYLDYLTGFWP